MNRQHVWTFLLTAVLVVSVIAVGPAAVVGEEFDDSVVEEVNDEEIAEANDGIEIINDGLENVADVETVATVEAENWDEAEAEADRLRDEPGELEDVILDQVVDEINVQAEDSIGQEIAEDVDTTEEAREEADRLRDVWGTAGGEDIEEAAESLESAADRIDGFYGTLNDAANELDSPETGTLEGTVVDSDGEPLAGIDVDPIQSSESATTDSEGQYELELADGEQPIQFSAEGYETSETTVEIAADETTDEDSEIHESEDEDDDEAATGETESSDGALGSTITTAGLALSGLALVSAIGLVGYGVVNRSKNQAVDHLQTLGAGIIFMIVSGLAIGSAGYLSIEWVLDVFSDGIGGLPEDMNVLEQLVPLVALVNVFLVAPAIAVVLGLTLGGRTYSRARVVGMTASSLIGGVALVILALTIIGLGTADSAIEFVDVVAVAGLVGAVSALGSGIAMTVTGALSPTG